MYQVERDISSNEDSSTTTMSLTKGGAVDSVVTRWRGRGCNSYHGLLEADTDWCKACQQKAQFLPASTQTTAVPL